MKKFGKRLLAGTVSFAMAVGLVPSGLLNPLTTKAAANFKVMGTQLVHLPGDGDHLETLWLESTESEEGWNAKITSLTVPKAYRSYMYIEQRDDNGYDLMTSDEWDGEQLIREGASGKEDSVGMTIPLSATFDDGEGHSGKTTINWVITDSIWGLENYDALGSNCQVLPGSSNEITFSAWHRFSKWKNDHWEGTDELAEGVTYEFLPDLGNDKVSMTGNGNVLTVTAPVIQEGADVNDYLGDRFVGINAYYNGEKVIEEGRMVSVSDEFYGLMPNNLQALIPTDMKIGATVNVKPEIFKYTVENPKGSPVEIKDLGWDKDDNFFTIESKNEDGSFTIRRNGDYDSDIHLWVTYDVQDDQGVHEEFLDTRARCFRFAGGLGDIETDTGNNMLFDSETSKVLTINTDQYDAARENIDYQVKWVVSRGSWDNHEETILGNDGTGYSATSAADGITVAADGKSITLDASVIVPMATVTRDDGWKEIDWDNGHNMVFVNAFLVNADGERFDGRSTELTCYLSTEDYSELMGGVKWINIMPGDMLFLDQFYY